MTDKIPEDEGQKITFVEYALIVALVAVLIIGVFVVLAPALSKILSTLTG